MIEDPVLQRVKTIVVTIAGPARTPPHVGGETLLGQDGLWLDSLELFEVILACEEEFGIRIDADAETTAGALRTVRGVADLIRAAPRMEPGPLGGRAPRQGSDPSEPRRAEP